MSLISEINESGKYLKDAYQALKANGASLPEKCNMANLASAIEESGGGGKGKNLTFEFYDGSSAIISTLDTDNNYGATSFIAASNANYNSGTVTFGTTGLGNLTLQKYQVTSAFLNAANYQPAPTNSQYLFGGSLTGFGYNNLKKLTIENLGLISNNFAANATALKAVVIKNSSFSAMVNFCPGCTALENVVLDNVSGSISSGFIYQAPNIQSVYVSDGITFPTSNLTTILTNRVATAPAYLNGVILKGPGAKVWKTTLPDIDGEGGYYRKLLLDPEWA